MSQKRFMRARIYALFAMALAIMFGGVGQSFAAQDGIGDRQPAQRNQQEWAPPTAVYVAETGQIVQGAILNYWRAWQGAASFGWPLTPELEEDGRIVQYFGYARLEQLADGTVRHGDIGVDYKPYVVEAMEAWAGAAEDQPTPALAEVEAVTFDEALVEEARGFLRAMESVDPEHVDISGDERRFVEATGHSIQFGFLNYWVNTGEDGYLGNPVTEPYTIGDGTYQIFERGQLRWEPQAAVRAEPVGLKLAQLRDLDMSAVPQGEVPTYSEELFTPPPTDSHADSDGASSGS